MFSMTIGEERDHFGYDAVHDKKVPGKHRKILLVVDLQRQFKDKDRRGYDRCLQYIRENRYYYKKVIGTVFSQCQTGKPPAVNFERYLDYTDCQHCREDDLEYLPDKVIIKSGYALPLQKSGLRQETDEIDIIGCDSDACVLATCFALFDGGYQFKILTPYIYSTSGDVMHNEAYDIMVRNFGKAVKKH